MKNLKDTILNTLKDLFKSTFSKRELFSPNHKYIVLGLLLLIMLIIGINFLIIPLFFPLFPVYLSHRYVWHFILYIFISFVSYISLYSWRKLMISVSSFLFFFCYVIILSLYCVGFLTLIYGIPKPILIEDLSQYSAYRYTFFLLITVVGIIIYVVIKKIPRLSSYQIYVDNLMFPYLKEEIRLILNTWEDSYFGPLFSGVINRVVYSQRKRYLCLHIIMTQIIPTILVCLLVNFSFFHGDCRFILYALPLSFVSWIYQNIFYYFSFFVEENSRELRELLKLTLLDPSIVINVEIVHCSTDQVSFSFTDKGLQMEGSANPEMLQAFVSLWQVFAEYSVLVTKNSRVTYYLNFFRFFIRFACWTMLFYSFFFGSDIVLTSSFILSRVNMIFVRPSVTKAYVVKKTHSAELEKLSKGAYKKPHPVTTDIDKMDDKKEVPFYHQPTHGKGTSDNPGKPLHDSKDLEGNSRPQNAVPPKSAFNFPEKWLGKPIKGSDEFYKNPDVKDNLKKHFPEIPSKDE